MKNTKQQRNQKGFTMIELMIVIVIMGVIGAAIVPSFGSMTKKAKVSTDVSNLKIVQRQIEIYEAETGTTIATKADGTANDLDAIVDALVTGKYIDEKYVENPNASDTKIKLQTKDSEVTYDATKKHLIITVPHSFDGVVTDVNVKDWVDVKTS